MFDNEDNDVNDRKKERKKEPKNNIDMPMADLYLHIVVITHM